MFTKTFENNGTITALDLLEQGGPLKLVTTVVKRNPFSGIWSLKSLPTSMKEIKQGSLDIKIIGTSVQYVDLKTAAEDNGYQLLYEEREGSIFVNSSAI